jgi:8-amino-7-oxononanoate synthase
VNEFLRELAARLRRLEHDDLRRGLTTPVGVDFSSNDYLGLAEDAVFHDRLRQIGVPATATAPACRLLRGHTSYHEELERRLARFKGTEAALLFSSGYQANIGVLTALVDRTDRVLSDALNHASLIDGIRLTRATKVIFPHLDLESLERALSTPHDGGRTLVVTESLFSMEGDIAPLDRYAELVEAYGAQLIVDDAHATGVYGADRGSGLTEHFGVERRVLAVVSTLGKALGVCGAFVGGTHTMVEYLVNRSRPFIFTTAQPPLLLQAIGCALDVACREPGRRAAVLDLARRFRRALAEHGVREVRGAGPIVPVVLGEAGRALQAAADLQREGFDVRAVRPPTVPPQTSRLRVSIHANHTPELVDALAAAVGRAVRQERVVGVEAAAP